MYDIWDGVLIDVDWIWLVVKIKETSFIYEVMEHMETLTAHLELLLYAHKRFKKKKKNIQVLLGKALKELPKFLPTTVRSAFSLSRCIPT